MEAAGQIFAEEGYPKATVRDICHQAGVNIAAINYHFGDKKGLYLTVLKHYQEIAFQTYPPDLGIKETQRPEEKLQAFIRSFLTRVMDEGRPAVVRKTSGAGIHGTNLGIRYPGERDNSSFFSNHHRYCGRDSGQRKEGKKGAALFHEYCRSMPLLPSFPSRYHQTFPRGSFRSQTD